MIGKFLQNPRIMVLMVIVLVAWGTSSLSTLPRSEDPHHTGRLGIVITHFPGASAERVETLITEKLETRLRELTEQNHITSTSRTGLSLILVEAKDSISAEEVELAWSKARNLIREASIDFPATATTPTLDTNRNHAFTLLIALHSDEADTTPGILARYSKELENHLRSVANTDFVDRFGAPREEVEVVADLPRLTNAGLTLDHMANALIRADTKNAAGIITSANSRFSVEVSGDLDSLDRIRQIPITTSSVGAVIRVGDVAQVKRGEINPPEDFAIIDGERAVVIGTRMIHGTRVDQWTATVKQALSEFEATLPENVTLDIIFSQDGYTQNRLNQLLGSVALGLLLIVIVLLITLGWRSALVVSAALPLNVLFTLGCMRVFDVPIHQVSVMGLVVALGIMVDNAIVMVNTISQEKRHTSNPITAASRALQHLWQPLLGSTLTTILAFMPIALMPGAGGEFSFGIAFSVITSLVGSYLISHTLIAALAGRFAPADSERSNNWWECGIHLPKLSRLFQRSLVWTTTRPLQAVLVTCSLPFLGYFSSTWMTEQFFPPSDRDMFHIEAFLPASYSLEATRLATDRFSEHIFQEQGIKRVDWFVGRSAPAFYYNLIQQRDGAANYAQAMVTASDYQTANHLIPSLQNTLDNAFPEAQILVRKLEQGPPFNAPVEYRLYGSNLDQLKSLGNELRRIASGSEKVIHTRSTLGSATPQLELQIDDETLQFIQLSGTGLAGQIRNALDGVVSGSLVEVTEELPVRVRLAADQRSTPQDLASLILLGGDDTNPDAPRGIPLSALTKIVLTPSVTTISRRDGERINTIEIYKRDGLLSAAVTKDIDQRLADAGFTLPTGYRMEMGGEIEQRNRAMGELSAYTGVLVALLLVLLVLSFNSFRLSLIIVSVAILSAGLGILCVFLAGFPFGFTSILGLMGLTGLAINAAIVIIAEFKADPEAISGQQHAIIARVGDCSRHITSTTITTLVGFLPLLIAGGNFWPPFAIAIAGGTVLTTLLSFYFTPALFLILARIKPFEQTAQRQDRPGSPAPTSH